MSATAREVKGPDPSRDKVKRQAGKEGGTSALGQECTCHERQCLCKKPPEIKHVLCASNPEERGTVCLRGTCIRGEVNPKTSSLENGMWTQQDVCHLEVRWTTGASPQGHVKMLPSDTCPENKAWVSSEKTDKNTDLPLLAPWGLAPFRTKDDGGAEGRPEAAS